MWAGPSPGVRRTKQVTTRVLWPTTRMRRLAAATETSRVARTAPCLVVSAAPPVVNTGQLAADRQTTLAGRRRRSPADTPARRVRTTRQSPAAVPTRPRATTRVSEVGIRTPQAGMAQRSAADTIPLPVHHTARSPAASATWHRPGATRRSAGATTISRRVQRQRPRAGTRTRPTRTTLR
jgi:hypothetical protein